MAILRAIANTDSLKQYKIYKNKKQLKTKDSTADMRRAILFYLFLWKSTVNLHPCHKKSGVFDLEKDLEVGIFHTVFTLAFIAFVSGARVVGEYF